MLLLATVQLLSSTISFAQAPLVQWYKCMGSEWIDNAQALDTTSDGGFIVVGHANGNGGDVSGFHGTDHGTTDIWIVKLSSTGTIQWQKCIGGTNIDFASAVHQTSDGGYIVGGSSTSVDGDASGNSGNHDCWLLKLNSTGSIVWQKTYGGSGAFEVIFDVQITPDGGYIAAGISNSADGMVIGNHGGTDIWVIKLSSTGTLLWQKNIGGTADERAYSIELTTDGGYLVTGTTHSNDGDISGNHGDEDLFVAKLANDGTIQWKKCFGGTAMDQGFNAKQSPDGGYIVLGITLSNDGDVTGNRGVTDIWVVKLDATGNLEWQRCYGSFNYDFASAIVITGNGYAIAGFAEAINGDVSCTQRDFWLFKINNAGVIEWQQTFGGNKEDQPFYLQNTKDGGWIAGGITTSTDLVGSQPNLTDVSSDVLIVKFTPENMPLPSPVVVINPGTPIICEGTVTFDFIATVIDGGNNSTCEWFVNGQSVGTGNNFTISNFANNDTVICVASVNASCNTAGGLAFDTVILRVNPVMQPTLVINSNTTSYCAGTMAVFTSSLSNGGSAPFYRWRVNGVNVASGDSFSSNTLKNGDLVNCEYSDSSICMSTQTILSNTIQVQITSSLTPSIDINTGSTAICSGNLVSFTAISQNAGTTPAYQWKLNGTNVGTNSPTYSTAALNNGDKINCVLTADPLAGCLSMTSANSDTITMVVKDGPPPAITITSSTNSICAGMNVQFDAVATNAGGTPFYQWKLNGRDVGTNLNSYSDSKLRNGDIIQCLVRPGTDACSLADILSSPITLTIHDTPIIRISPSSKTIKYMEKTALSANVTGNISSYQWTPAAQLENARTLNPTTIALTSTTTFTLTVFNTEGCKSISQAEVKVLKQLDVMPNAFTPNGDGKNDVFRIPPGYSVDLIDFSVFDRWGNLVFTTKDVGKGWDGTFNGKKAPAGAYVYYIKGTYEGQPINIKGNIGLVR